MMHPQSQTLGEHADIFGARFEPPRNETRGSRADRHIANNHGGCCRPACHIGRLGKQPDGMRDIDSNAKARPCRGTDDTIFRNTLTRLERDDSGSSFSTQNAILG
jgi:hypothetical protein